MKFLFAVTLMLASSCSVADVECYVYTIPNINFGSYDPFSTNATEVKGESEIRCSSPYAEKIYFTLSLSAGSSNKYKERHMIGPGKNILAYNIYTDSNRTQIFGNGTQGSVTEGGNRNIKARPEGSRITGRIYGRIPAGQSVAVGNYTDSLIYTINF